MARFLFVIPPMVGHINPTVSVATELESLGHQVAWVGYRGVAGPLLPESAEIFGLDSTRDLQSFAEASTQALSLRGPSALKFLWEDVLIPLARTMLPGVRPSISLASRPTARTRSAPRPSLTTAPTLGSDTTMPRFFAYTSVFAVPRSIARSLEKSPRMRFRTTVALPKDRGALS